jgi:hypothetical protein
VVWATKEALVLNYAVSRNVELQDNGRVANRMLPDVWKKVPVIAVQRNATGLSGGSMPQDMQAVLQDSRGFDSLCL